MKLIRISPKGQITLPKGARDSFKVRQVLFEIHGNVITLRPAKIEAFEDELGKFSGLAEPSFDFWNNKEDDVYQDFYNKS